MASASRTAFLFLGLLVASLCVAANAGAVGGVQGTAKVAMDATALATGATKLVADLVGPVTVALVVDARKVKVGEAVTVELPGAVGGPKPMDVVGGVVTALQPVCVTITVAGTLNVVVEVLGMKKEVALPLSLLTPVLDAVNDLLKVVVAVVQTVVDGVDVVQLVNAAGTVVATITRAAN